MRWPLVAAWTCAVAAAAAAAAVLVARGADADPASGVQPAVLLAAAIPALVAGVAIARVRSSGPIGPLLALIGLMAAADAALTSWADAAGDLPGASLAAMLYGYDWVPVFAAVAVLLMVFPDGHPPGPRWRWAVAVAVVAPALLLVSGLFRDAPLAAPYEDLPRPFPPAPAPFSDVLTAIALPLLAIALALAALAIVLRFRRSEGVERIQLKWLAGVAALIPGSFAVCLAASLLSEDAEAVTAVAFGLMYVAVVGAVAVAMLRHGLFDVDRVISRAIAWGTLSLVLVGLFAIVALAVAIPLGGGSAVATALAALAAAAAFDPLRRRLQALVDRRFDRDRSAAVRRVDAFATRLREGRAEPEDVEDVLREALGDPGLRLLVWLPEAGVHADLAGAIVDDPAPPPGRVATAVGRGEAPLGLLIHAERLRSRPGLLADVVRAAALPVEMARLHGELRRRLDEVEESRARIVRAGYEERRRLERDLHDGTQQRLVALGMGLRRLQRRPDTAPDVAVALDEAVEEVGQAVRDLREIARGLRPGALDAGLAPALAELGRRTPLPVEVEGPGDRVPAGVEAAAYYVVCEAIANTVKHAGATRIVVRARTEDGHLLLSVSDDGCGGAAAAAGGGLAGLADRVAAHGGTLALDSRSGHGTLLEVVLPCAS